jgi:hypothetical protein
MADGSMKPIGQVKIGDTIADSVPGESGVRDNAVTNVIATYADRDFVDVTVEPVGSTTTASAGTASAPDAASAMSSAKSPASPVAAVVKRASLVVAGGLGALAVLLGGAGHPATGASGSAGNAAKRSVSGPAVVAAAWSRDDAAPTADAQQQARQATAAATTAAERVGGGTITTTFLHPFYDQTQTSFVEAEHLHVGDIVQTPTGTAQITNLHLYHADTTTYDLTIGNLHTFYVVAGDTSVLVHNCDRVIHWVNENASMPDYARQYDAGAAGSRTGLAPALQYYKEGSNTLSQVKFDGVQDGVLIDRKWAISTKNKTYRQAINQSLALEQNGYLGSWEVPTQAEATRAQKMFSDLKITNITVRVVPS